MLRLATTSTRAAVPSVRAYSTLNPFSSSSSGYSNQRSYGGYEDRPRRNNYNSSNNSGGRSATSRRLLPAFSRPNETPLHLMTLADLSVPQLSALTLRALTYKHMAKHISPSLLLRPLEQQTIALIFSKRSTRTRVASESALQLLGGHPMFLGTQDIQMGVNETLEDSARVIGSMVNGIMARVGEHEEVEALAKYSGVPVINALSRLYHPTQILADIMTLQEVWGPKLEVPQDTERMGFKSLLNHLKEQVSDESLWVLGVEASADREYYARWSLRAGNCSMGTTLER